MQHLQISSTTSGGRKKHRPACFTICSRCVLAGTLCHLARFPARGKNRDTTNMFHDSLPTLVLAGEHGNIKKRARQLVDPLLSSNLRSRGLHREVSWALQNVLDNLRTNIFCSFSTFHFSLFHVFFLVCFIWTLKKEKKNVEVVPSVKMTIFLLSTFDFFGPRWRQGFSECLVEGDPLSSFSIFLFFSF